jgi:uncharacterized protein (TIGR02594 family)
MTSRLLEVCESRLGIQEIAGKKHNKAILAMWVDAGHPEIQTDEEFWCSAFMCSSAKEAQLPMPPKKINPMARSWLTWGVAVNVADAQPGDVPVWPRGKKGSGSGHVNCIKDVRRSGGSVFVRCIGGNQSDPSGGAVTLTDWTDLSGAVGVRRAVPSTIPELRNAGSTTIKAADNVQKATIATGIVTSVVEAVSALTGPLDVPAHKSLPEGLSWWQSVLGGVNAIAKYFIAHPFLFVAVVGGLGLLVWAQRQKWGRVAENAAGVPIAAEMAKLDEEDED